MKARLLKKLLNDTDYNVNNNTNYIAVGSPLCHDLISVDKKTLKVKYALDTFREGRKSLKSDELTFVWDRLHELIESGQIQDIINGKDEIENPLPVYYVEDGKLIETFTDAYGWPNTTIDGDMMYNNEYFKTKEEAISQGIKECESGIEINQENLKEARERVDKIKIRLGEYHFYLDNLRSIMPEIKS